MGLITHGLRKHPLYKTWLTMKNRCLNKNDKSYYYYGERGIKVCDEWLNDFKCFYDWCVDNGWKAGLELDRQKNNEGYSPSNCRFITHKANCRNKRNNTILLYKGENKTISEWAEFLGINCHTISSRLNRDKLSIEDALRVN